MVLRRKMHPCRRVDVGFIATAPHRFTNSVELAITPAQLFEVLADAESWPHWAAAITKVTWTSPAPYGVGTTRTVDMRGGLVGDEEFIAWEPYAYLAFRFNASSTRTLGAFAEDYRVQPTADGCRLTWTMALAPLGPARLALRVGGPVMNWMLRWFLRRLRRYTDQRFTAEPMSANPGA